MIFYSWLLIEHLIIIILYIHITVSYLITVSNIIGLFWRDWCEYFVNCIFWMIFLWRFLFPVEMQVTSSECVSWHSKVHAKLVISVISPASIWFFLLYFFPESHNCELEATKKKDNVSIHSKVGFYLTSKETDIFGLTWW